MSGIFSGGGGGGWMPQPQPLATSLPSPTPIAPPPDRSDEEIRMAAEAQRRKYGITGGRTPTNLTGGLGIPTGAINSAAATLLGG